jgi:hypothetical protein
MSPIVLGIPSRRQLRIALVVFGLSSAVWIPLEGKLWQSIVLALFASTVVIGQLLKVFVVGRPISAQRLTVTLSLAGLIFGFSAVLFTLLAMSFKTGLHAHGPEFTPVQIDWVLKQFPVWTAAGLVAGLGLATLLRAFHSN